MSSTKIELSVRVLRDDKTVPFESRVEVPLDGRDPRPTVEQWLTFMEAAVKYQSQPAAPSTPSGEGEG